MEKERCLTLHQPWASLLVYGIKQIEGRSWHSSVRGRLWIHAAARVPEKETVQELEKFYGEVYAAQGVNDVKFPEFYPVSVLLGCVNVVDCVKMEDVVSHEELPQSIRMEALSDYCWLCEDPQKLVVPFQMRGWQGVYNLDKKVATAALRGLKPVQGPGPFKFPAVTAKASPESQDNKKRNPVKFKSFTGQDSTSGD